MKFANIAAIAAQSVNQTTITSSLIPLDQIIKMSGQVIVGAGTSGGTLQLQVSNDITNASNMAGQSNFVPSNWSNLGSAVTINAAGVTLIAQQDLCYRWLRAVYTDTLARVNTVTAVADTGKFETITITCPATAGATQADYVKVFNPAGTSAAFWLDIDAAGVAPTGAAYVSATNKIKVSIVAAGSAADTGAALAAAANNIIGYAAVDNLDGTVTITQTGAFGPTTAPARHNANDSGNGSFTLSVGQLGVVSNLNSAYYTLQNGSGTSFYIWFSVSSLGVDPALPGKTGIPVAFAGSASANTIATAIRAAAVTGTVITGSSAQAIYTNSVAGPATPAADGAAPTGFTFANNVPTSTIALNLMTLGI